MGPADARHGGPLRLPRRGLLRAGLGLAALAGPGRGTFAAGALPPDLLFDVARKGSRIGSVQVRFRPDGPGFAVGTVWDLAVKIAFVTVYTYRQDADDRWRDGRLVRSDIATADNGRATAVRLREEAGAVRVDGPAGAYTVEPGTMTDVCFWNVAITGQTRIIDGQNGDLVPLRAAPPVDETITVQGRPLPTTRYGFAGTPSRHGHQRDGRIWYDRSGRWVRAEIDTHGDHLSLELAG